MSLFIYKKYTRQICIQIHVSLHITGYVDIDDNCDIFGDSRYAIVNMR